MGCSRCSMGADHFNPSVIHLAQRDVTLIAVSRAPFAEIDAFKKRMGWGFHWVSSYGSDFNYDYRVSFTPEEMASERFDYNYGLNGFPAEEATGTSVFYKDSDGSIFHTYSSYARAAEGMLVPYHFLDLVPKGRDEEDLLPDGMTWVRYHDSYDERRVSAVRGVRIPGLKSLLCSDLIPWAKAQASTRPIQLQRRISNEHDECKSQDRIARRSGWQRARRCWPRKRN